MGIHPPHLFARGDWSGQACGKLPGVLETQDAIKPFAPVIVNEVLKPKAKAKGRDSLPCGSAPWSLRPRRLESVALFRRTPLIRARYLCNKKRARRLTPPVLQTQPGLFQKGGDLGKT
ncbi:hypothetical protein ROR02_08440 [Pararhodospirillum oryzae]|uniref:Uncharacterized protein n=1 Tax=Pararhodospirillum oryzae TaxID=478448 RepID=A0A512H5J7_9PROT|nr:hypothetical protein ROR02_08440 [Pararhodospirillum oryzae]